MNYLVMETHPAYAVVLDEEGRFLKAANLRYHVGDTIEHIVPLRQPVQKNTLWMKSLAGVAGLAACLCLVFFGYYQPNFLPYGTLRIQINPDVELTVSKTDRVLDLEGLNDDGMELIQGYDYHGKDRDTAADDLMERAIDMGFLSDGDTVSITVTSSDLDWQVREETELRQHLEERYGDTVVIRLGGDDIQPAPSDEIEIVIPVVTPAPETAPPASPAPPTTPPTVPPTEPVIPSTEPDDDDDDDDDDDNDWGDDDWNNDDWDDDGPYDDDWDDDDDGDDRYDDDRDDDDWDDDDWDDD